MMMRMIRIGLLCAHSLLVALSPLQAGVEPTCVYGELEKGGEYRPLGGLDGCMIDLPIGDGVMMRCLYKDAQVWCPMTNDA